jgi:hypothetical protein
MRLYIAISKSQLEILKAFFNSFEDVYCGNSMQKNPNKIFLLG